MVCDHRVMDPAEFAAVQEKLRERCRRFDDLGQDFQSLCEMLLRELGFVQVQEQSSGSQNGRDFSAFRELSSGRESWFFECKNLEKNIDVTMAAAKLIHHLHRKLHAFVLIGPSQLSNDLRELLGNNPLAFPVVDWTAENFVRAMLASPVTRRHWFPEIDVVVSQEAADEHRRALFSAAFPPARPLEVRVEPLHSPPFQRAYFLDGDALQQFDTDLAYQHALVLHNQTRASMIVTAVSVTTIAYRPLPERILVQMKMKGAYEPLTLTYRPAATPGAATELLGGRMRQLAPGETELHYMTLEGAPPGVYHLRVHVTYLHQGRERRDEVCDLRLCACVETLQPPTVQRLQLFTWRGHYPGLARIALSRTEKELTAVAALLGENKLVYLGPIPYAEMGAGPEQVAHARITVVPLLRVSDTEATMQLEDAIEHCDWGPSHFGERTPKDPQLEMRGKAEALGLSFEEYTRIKLHGAGVLDDASND